MGDHDIPITRVKRSKETAKLSYNRLSKWYDLLAGTSEQAACKEGLQLLKIERRESVLEIGFGTGHSLMSLASAVGEAGHVYGIDLSEGMLAVAEARLERAGFLKRADLRCGDAVRLPFPSEMVDAIFSAFTLELFDSPEIPIVLTECKRVLKAKGRICIVSLSKHARPNLMTRLYEWAHEKWPAVIDCRPIQLRQVVEQAGFEISQLACRSMWGLSVEIALGYKV